LVEAAEKMIAKKPGQRLRILDIGTGSGNIIVSLAKRNPGHIFYAIDVSSNALKVATTNAATHNVLNHITFLHGDILRGLDFLAKEKEFDIIISNPPYIKTNDIETLSCEVQQEPRIALDGGADGLCFYREIARVCAYLLSADGVLCLEIGQGQEAQITEILLKVGSLRVQECFKDYLDIQGIIIVKRK